jgi:hypothetical protein
MMDVVGIEDWGGWFVEFPPKHQKDYLYESMKNKE